MTLDEGNQSGDIRGDESFEHTPQKVAALR